MAARRKVANLLALAVLSTVYQRPMHRYEMASIMRVRGKEQDMDIKWGSLYTVVDNMEKHGFLETIGNTRQGARPERTVYQITESGRRELVDWTRELLSSVDPEHPRFAAGLSVLSALPPDEVIELLQIRLDSLDASLASQRAAIGDARAQVPRLFLIENEYAAAMTAAEAAWIRALLDELTSGTYPDLVRWRAWHQTGEMPADLAELAERGATSD
jgi:DNA-binding PadR family transcriptional regulator